MIVRFGFVAMSLLLENASPSRTMTYTAFSKLEDRGAAIRRLERIAEENLNNTLRILKHCKAHEIAMYRFSSKLIPLATHEDLHDWDKYAALSSAFREVGQFVKRNGIRTSFHPDHFCVFSTPRAEVLEKSVKDLEHHVRMLELMELDETSKNNIHMGGAYGNKEEAGARFIEQFSALPARCKQRVTLENDDKTFNVRETLKAAEAVSVPMVLDLHHHAVNPGDLEEDELVERIWPRIAGTWQAERERLGLKEASQLPPKIHASSPKSVTDPRAHAENVEAGPLLRFLKGVARGNDYLDCMLEAKNKDAALLKLMEDFKQQEAKGEGVKILDGASIEISPY